MLVILNNYWSPNNFLKGSAFLKNCNWYRRGLTSVFLSFQMSSKSVRSFFLFSIWTLTNNKIAADRQQENKKIYKSLQSFSKFSQMIILFIYLFRNHLSTQQCKFWTNGKNVSSPFFLLTACHNRCIYGAHLCCLWAKGHKVTCVVIFYIDKPFAALRLLFPLLQ